MTARRPQPSTVLLPFSTAPSSRSARGGVLAVVGGALDEAVLDLAVVLAHDVGGPLDLVHLIELPLAVPLVAYSRMLGRDQSPSLRAALDRCGDEVRDAGIVLCRAMGPALVAETRQRRSLCLVLGAPSGGWWSRLRGRRALAHIQAGATCRVYMVHSPAPPEQDLPRAAVL